MQTMTLLKKKFEEKFNSPMRKRMERQLVKRRLNVYGSAISNFFGVKDFLKRMMCNKNNNLQTFCLLLVKNQLPFHLKSRIFKKYTKFGKENLYIYHQIWKFSFL